jgi:hypothetical protein
MIHLLAAGGSHSSAQPGTSQIRHSIRCSRALGRLSSSFWYSEATASDYDSTCFEVFGFVRCCAGRHGCRIWVTGPGTLRESLLRLPTVSEWMLERLHFGLSRQGVQVAADGGGGESAATAAEVGGPVPLFDAADEINCVPTLGMTNIPD